jgi:ATP-binding cassette subfamily B protein
MQTDELYELTDELLNSNQPVRLKVGGFSMFPFLRNGDEIIVNKCAISELSEGDVLVFKSSAKWIAHRLLKIKKENGKTILITKGDSCIRKDHPVTEDNFIGKVISFQRKNKEKNINTDLQKKINRFFVRLSGLFTLFIVVFLSVKLRYKKIKESIRNIFKSLLFICKESKLLTFTNLFISVIQGVLPFVTIYLFKLMIDVISRVNASPDKTELLNNVIIIIVITGGVFLFNAVLNIISSELKERLSQSISVYIFKLLHLKYVNLDMAYLEDADQQDKIHRAVQESGFRPLKMVSESFTAVQSITSWIVIAVLLFAIHWIVFLLILIAVIPGFYVRFKYSVKLYHLNKSNSTKERESYYYNRILTSLAFAKEIRLFGTGNFFRERFHNIQKYLHKQKNAIYRKRAIADTIAQIFAISVLFFSFGFVSNMALNGLVSLGTVVLFFFIFQRGYSILKDFFQSVAGLYEDNVFLSDFFEFLNLPSLRKSSSSEKNIQPLEKGIFIENVCFHYPSSQRKALEEVTIHIPAGKTVAFVGPNGSGKTTIVKLLCGFYVPDSGNILFDDNDISIVNPEDIRKNITVVFQDFALYNLSAAENILLGDITGTSSVERVKRAAKSAGIDDILKKLPSGYNNIIGNLFEKGEELSIGQWQKMAIARAFYRNSPILFMDEPSSALDAETELQLLQNLRSLSKDKTVLIISHRFSTIQWADIIYVLDNGKVIEHGSHDQLISLRGKYYQMFEVSRMN